MNLKTQTTIINIISKIIGILFLLLAIIWIGGIIIVNILPNAYLSYLIIPAGMVLIMIFFLFSKKTNLNLKKGLTFFTTLIIMLMVIGLNYAFQTIGFLDNLNFLPYKTEKYYVLVLKDSRYHKLPDLNNQTMSINQLKTAGLTMALETIESQIKIKKIRNINLNEAATALLNKEVESMLIEQSYLTILKEENLPFASLTKAIYSVTVKIKTKSIVKKVDVTKEPFNIYVSGLDTYGTINSVSRSDVNIVANINPLTSKIILVAIPRDYYVQLHGTNGYKDKLTHAGIYGIDMSVKTIEDLLKIDINYYVKINFTSLVKSVDAIDGIDVNSLYTFTSQDGFKYTKGINHMNGAEALSFSRERHTLPGGDRARGLNQEAVIKAMITKITGSTIITSYDKLLKALDGTFQTNLPTSSLKALVKNQINHMPSWNIKSFNLDGTDSSNYTYSYPNQMLYVMEPTLTTITLAQEAITNNQLK